MNADSLRDVLKSGPMAEVYARLRYAKRRLRHEPIAGALLSEHTPLEAEELRRMVPLLPGHARLFFSLGLQYMESDRPEDMPKALACLRSAQTLGFESPDRVALYKALIAARSGHREEAQRQIESLVPYELTSEENALREEIAQDRITPHAAQAFPEPPVLAGEADTLLVIGDPAALTSNWFPHARYLLADESVTGLPLTSLASLNISFDVVVGPPEMRGSVDASGLTATRWMDL